MMSHSILCMSHAASATSPCVPQDDDQGTWPLAADFMCMLDAVAILPQACTLGLAWSTGGCVSALGLKGAHKGVLKPEGCTEGLVCLGAVRTVSFSADSTLSSGARASQSGVGAGQSSAGG